MASAGKEVVAKVAVEAAGVVAKAAEKAFGKDAAEVAAADIAKTIPELAARDAEIRLPASVESSVADLVKERGAAIGRQGSGPTVREVRSVEELQGYFDTLTKGGYKDITPPGFPGKMAQLPDGTIVNWRTQSKSTGSIPTLDVNPGNGQTFKVHVNPTGW
ncbi:MAG: hypothetical protein J2P15_08035 [Micromonosporaceae bacterium]|nr:hypothetical protein [Micromonosporaceae bacterium]